MQSDDSTTTGVDSSSNCGSSSAHAQGEDEARDQPPGGHDACVHADAAWEDGMLTQQWRVLKKEEVIDWSNCVARIMTNRRSHWQRKV